MIKFKPPEFKQRYCNLHVARAFGYDYVIMEIDQDEEFWLCVAYCGNGIYHRRCGNGFYHRRCKTMKSAIEAANKHFQARVSEWLEKKKTKKQTPDLNDQLFAHIFAQLERLGDKDLTPVQIETVAQRVKATVYVAAQLERLGDKDLTPDQVDEVKK